MPLTRRQFLIGAAATAGTGAAAVATAEWMKGLAEPPPMPRDNTSYSTGPITQASAPTPPANVQPPSVIASVLTRMSFGPRPGEVERVAQLGLDRYIEQQIHPETLDDSALDKMLAAFPSLTMSVAQLYENYPQAKAQAKP